MKNAFVKDIFREIKNSLGRFLSIFTIIALGCGFFAGIKATMPDMVDSAKKYFDDNQLMDLKMLSTVGVRSEDVEAVKKADNVKGVMAGYSKDVFYSYKNRNIVLKFMSYNDRLDDGSKNKLNKPVLIEGRFPDKKGECVAEVKVNSPDTIKIGNTIKITEPDKEKKITDTLECDEYKIVGIVTSPMYIGYERDSTNVGNGSVLSNIYVPEYNFVCDYYTEIYMTFDSMENYEPFSKAYRKAVREKKIPAVKAFEKSVNDRFDELYSQTEEKLDNAQEKADELEKVLSCDEKQLIGLKMQSEESYKKSKKDYEDSAGKIDAQRSLLKTAMLQNKEVLDMVSGLTVKDKKAAAVTREEYNKKLESAKAEIKSGKEQLKGLEKPKFYQFNRFATSNDYSSFYGDSQKIDSIAKVFPVFFILVAALVCLTTMTRMIEEQRTTIGTYKALGYSSGKIAGKYLTYGLISALLGSSIGTVAGLQIFPYIIYNTYKIMYSMPSIDTKFRPMYFIGCCVVSAMLTCFAVLYSCYKELKAQPSELMRPKPPAKGQRVALEKVGFIWKRLGFLTKVTIRNLLRYKKRFFMTIVGIAGCTALIVTGFGLKNSIKSIADRQFNDIFLYDGIMVLNKDKFTQSEIKKKISEISEIDKYMLMCGEDGSAENKYSSQSLTVMVTENPEKMGEFISLKDIDSGSDIKIEEGSAVITEKLSKLMKLKAGDFINVKIAGGRSGRIKISGIVKNYTMHYVYITPDTYEELYGSKPVYNGAIIELKSGINEDKFKEQLIKNDEFYGMTYKEESGKSFVDSVDRLDVIVFMLILCAGLLAIVVLYNLTNINITERVREIATIKVLGFYDGEASAYIYRENIISMIIGIIAGWVMGIILHRFVVLTAEVDIVMFNRQLIWWAYVYAALLTLAFTVIVNVIMHFKLKKIDMVESLKSVE